MKKELHRTCTGHVKLKGPLPSLAIANKQAGRIDHSLATVWHVNAQHLEQYAAPLFLAAAVLEKKVQPDTHTFMSKRLF